MFSRRVAFRLQNLRTGIFILILYIVTGCKTPSIVATQAIQQGDMANNQNQYALAIQHYTRYLEVAPSLGTMRNPEMEAGVCRKLAQAYSTQGKYQEALNYLSQALAKDENDTDNLLNVIEDHRQIGLTYVYLGKYKEALEALNKALELNSGMEASIKSVKKLSIADTYLSKAQLELSQGLFNDCEKDLHKAAGIYQQTDKEGLGMIEANLLFAKLYLAGGQADSAMVFVDKSIVLARKKEYKIFRQLQIEGDIQMLNGDLQNAILTKEEGLTEALKGNIKPQIIWAHLRLGDAYEVIGDKKKAKEHFSKARVLEEGMDTSSLNPSLKMRLGDVKNAYELFNNQGATLGKHIATLKLAELRLNDHDLDFLDTILLDSYRFFADQKIVAGEVKANLLLSILYQQQGNYDEAFTRLKMADNLEVNPESKWRIWYNMGMVASYKGHYTSAEEWFIKAIELIEKQRNELTRADFRWYYLDSKVDVYDAYITMLLSQESVSDEQIRQAFALNERARARTFLDMLATQRIKDLKKDRLVSREQSLSQKITFVKNQIEYNSIRSIDNSDLMVTLASLDKSYTKVITALEQSNVKYTNLKSIAPTPLTEVMATLDNETALLEFWVGKNNLIAWRIDNKSITFKISDLSRDEVRKGVTKTRTFIKYGMQERIVQGFSDLYNDLSPMFQDAFTDYQQVGVIPHGPLHYIPFASLYGQGRFLVEKANIFYAPSASVYYYCTNRKSVPDNKSLLGYALGGLQLAEFSALPGTALELEQLSQFYDKNQCVYGENLSEAYFKEAASDYNFIHIASHGVMNIYNPGKSYILMAPEKQDDGHLTVEEIYNLNLDAEFVTLSACETGLGDLSDGDELVGLSRAFIYAGTSAVIVSLWNVDDLSTSILMTKMHQLIDAGLSLSEALSLAQRDLITSNFNPRASRGMRSIEWKSQLRSVINSKDTKFNSPYFWAPFIIIGDPKIN